LIAQDAGPTPGNGEGEHRIMELALGIGGSLRLAAGGIRAYNEMARMSIEISTSLHFRHSNVRSSRPSSVGIARNIFICAEHLGHAGIT
jgi:hypothetical protein